MFFGNYVGTESSCYVAIITCPYEDVVTETKIDSIPQGRHAGLSATPSTVHRTQRKFPVHAGLLATLPQKESF